MLDSRHRSIYIELLFLMVAGMLICIQYHQIMLNISSDYQIDQSNKINNNNNAISIVNLIVLKYKKYYKIWDRGATLL